MLLLLDCMTTRLHDYTTTRLHDYVNNVDVKLQRRQQRTPIETNDQDHETSQVKKVQTYATFQPTHQISKSILGWALDGQESPREWSPRRAPELT